jgi:hypothetical protein
MRRLPLIVLAAVLVPGLSLGACSRKDTSAKDLREQISTALQKGEDGLTSDQADCYAKLLIPTGKGEKAAADRINDLKITDKEPKKALATELAAAATKARTECGIG